MGWRFASGSARHFCWPGQAHPGACDQPEPRSHQARCPSSSQASPGLSHGRIRRVRRAATAPLCTGALFKFQRESHLLQFQWLRHCWAWPLDGRHTARGKEIVCGHFGAWESAMPPRSPKEREIEISMNRTNEYNWGRISGRGERAWPYGMKYINGANFGTQLDLEEQRIFHGKNPKDATCICFFMTRKQGLQQKRPVKGIPKMKKGSHRGQLAAEPESKSRWRNPRKNFLGKKWSRNHITEVQMLETRPG
ncbi:uncharacterized protein LOC121488670 isoform X2 [Vulpes lagopus]|uniref:uncharacterized protein LOC121488670 isoform X2 n=1 Tax=Vulpes lagopus TaxID=494514 RepID=UPI001BC99132|nr:uncharacterized protein LOC121488670 isoform X2 [Vulpes lagopus]